MSLKSKPVKMPENCKLKILTNGMYTILQKVFGMQKKRGLKMIEFVSENSTKQKPN